MLKLLFKTDAFKVSAGDNPFWYTSGKIGPFYINTHFLYGDKESAERFLHDIDSLTGDRDALIRMLEESVQKQYDENVVYRGTINELIKVIRGNIDLDSIPYVSGGERRDWFFSVMCAKILNKPHIYLFKDNTSFPDYTRGNCLHIADLITEGSSYERSWIPALKSMDITMTHTAVCVDRNQAGHLLLERLGVKLLSLVRVDKSMFDTLLDKGMIDAKQYDLLSEYSIDPDNTMRKFISEHPDFLENALKSDEKTKQRALLCIEKGYYS